MGWAGNLHRPYGRTERNTKTCGAGEQALTISLISTKSGPWQALLRSRHHLHPYQSRANLSVCLSLSLFRYNGFPPITCTQSLVVLGDNATVPLSKRSKRPSLGSWFLVFGLKTAGCWSQMQHLEVNLAAAERHESSAPLNSLPRPWSGSLFSSSCGCSLTPNRDHREIPKMEKKTRRSNAESLAVFPTLSLPGRLPGSCKSIPTHVGKTRSRCPVCRGLTPSRMPGYCPVLFDWSGPSMSSPASRR